MAENKGKHSEERAVSVIITTYNSAKTIRDCLSSVINQKGVNPEIIVVDDRSEDNTKRIVSEFPSVRFVSTVTHFGGPMPGRKIGADMATNDILCFLDHDDVWDLHKLSVQLQYIDDGVIVFTKTSRRRTRYNANYDVTRYGADRTHRNLMLGRWGECIQLSTLMVKKSDCSFADVTRVSSDFWWIANMTRGNRTVRIDLPLVMYREKKTSVIKLSKSPSHRASHLRDATRYILARMQGDTSAFHTAMNIQYASYGKYALRNPETRIHAAAYFRLSGASFKNLIYLWAAKLARLFCKTKM